MQTWVISNHVIGAHVRAYASLHGLNSNDKPSPVTAYSTRVERAVKKGDVWELTLRHLKFLEESNRINATWWTEDFDAVVVATGPYDAPHVPEIDGLLEWSKVKAVDDPSRWSVYHSRVYRKPQRYENKVRPSPVLHVPYCLMPDRQSSSSALAHLGRRSVETSHHTRRRSMLVTRQVLTSDMSFK